MPDFRAVEEHLATLLLYSLHGHRAQVELPPLLPHRAEINTRDMYTHLHIRPTCSKHLRTFRNLLRPV